LFSCRCSGGSSKRPKETAVRGWWGEEQRGVQGSAGGKLEGSMGWGESLQSLHHPGFWLEAGKTESREKDCI